MTIPAEMTLTRQLAEFAVGTASQAILQSSLDAARNAFVDTVGCGIRGATLGPARAVKKALERLELPGTYICFDGSYVFSAENAAYINATAAHSLELDDTDAKGLTHPGVVVIPAALAVAQDFPLTSGHDLLEAIVVGYDIALRLARWINPKHRMRGFHTTSTITTLGAVAAVARLRGMTVDDCVSAMGIALSYAGGSFEFVAGGSNLKRVHAGKAASTAIQACSLAAAGVEGPPTALEGTHGFYATCVGGEMDPLDLSDLGHVFLIEQVGTKRHACCRFCHTAIDAAIDLYRQGHFLDEGSTIEVAVSSLCHEQTGLTAPENELQRQFSTPYGVALGLLRGRTLLSDYQDEPDPQALDLTRRIRMVTDRDIEPSNRRATVTLRTATTQHSQTLDEPRGEQRTPFTEQDRFEKFTFLTSEVLPSVSVELLYQSFRSIQDAPAVTNILETLKSCVASTTTTSNHS